MKKLIPGVAALVMTCALSCPSWATLYSVNDSVGSGNVTGSIQTDGTLGVLGLANILNWNLLLNDGTSTFDLLGPTSGNNSGLLLQGTSFTATASGLFFDFGSATNAYADFRNPASGSAFNYLCLQDTNGQCSSDASDLVINVSPDSEQISREVGIVQVATAVPEPASIALLATALAGLALVRGRKKAGSLNAVPA